MANELDAWKAPRRGVEGNVPHDGPITDDFPVKIGGEDYAGTRAILTLLAGNSSLTYMSLIPGAIGNNIKITYSSADPAVANKFRLEVSKTNITIYFNAVHPGTVNMWQVLNAINDHEIARRMVAVKLAPGSNGQGNISAAGANLAGGAGQTLVYPLHVNSAGEVTITFSDDIIGTPGVAIPAKGVAVGGTDGANFRHIRTDATGAVEVIQPTAADLEVTSTQPNAALLNCTEASAAAIVGTSDVAAPTDGAQIGGLAHSGNPAPMSADNDFVRSLHTLLGQLRVFMDSALNRVNDEVRSEDIAPPEIVAHGNIACSATQGNTVQLTAVSTELKRGVWIMVNPNQGVAMPGAGARQIIGASYTSANNTIISTAGLFPNLAGFSCRRTALVEGCINDVMFVPIDDPSKVYVASNTASLEALWVAA